MDERGDIFALAVMVVEALTGSRPFVGRTSAELMASIVGSPFHVAGEAAEVKELDHILQKCLAKDRRERFPSVAAMQLEMIPAIQRCPPFPSKTISLEEIQRGGRCDENVSDALNTQFCSAARFTRHSSIAFLRPHARPLWKSRRPSGQRLASVTPSGRICAYVAQHFKPLEGQSWNPPSLRARLEGSWPARRPQTRAEVQPQILPDHAAERRKASSPSSRQWKRKGLRRR